MIKNLFLGVAAATLISACGGSETASDVSSSPATTSGGSSRDAACVSGRYIFQVPSDGGKWHFDSIFDGQGGMVNNFTGGDRQSYSATDSTVTWAGTFGGRVSTFTYNITSKASDCTVLEFWGPALDGTPARFIKG